MGGDGVGWLGLGGWGWAAWTRGACRACRARKPSSGRTAPDTELGLTGARLAGLSLLGPRGLPGTEAVPRARRAPDSGSGLAGSSCLGLPSAEAVPRARTAPDCGPGLTGAQQPDPPGPEPVPPGARAWAAWAEGCWEWGPRGLAIGPWPWALEGLPGDAAVCWARAAVPVGPRVVRASGCGGSVIRRGAVRRGPGRRASARARRTPRSRRRGSGSPGRSHRSHHGWSRGRRRSGRSGPRVPVRPR